MEGVLGILNGRNSVRIPVLMLGESSAPDTGMWDAFFGIVCDVTRVAEAQCLPKALDAALAASNALLLLGGFQGEDMPPLALLTEMLAQALQIEESQLALRFIGQEDEAGSAAVLYKRDIRLYACSAAQPCREEVLEEIQAHAGPVTAPNPANAWLPPAGLARRVQKTPARRAPKARTVPGTPGRQPRSMMPLLAILAAACLAFCVGVGYLIYYAADSGLQDARSRQVQALYPPVGAQGADLGVDKEAPPPFEALRGLNSDCVGWLQIPGAGVNLPVMLESTNDYYLSHDAQRHKSRFGALFLDSDNEVSTGGQSPNLSIFGHNTKNGSMFGQLHNYRDLAFYRQNAVFQFDTIYARRQWVVFAVFITNAKPAQDYGTVFEWREQGAAAPENIAAFAAALKQRSVLHTGVDVRPGDELLSLTTCAYEIKDGRLVVFARALRPGEAPPDTARARENPTPLYPAAWYVNYGGEKPDLQANFG